MRADDATTYAGQANRAAHPNLDDFSALAPSNRSAWLLDLIRASHRRHFLTNAAYRRTVTARGVGEDLDSRDPAMLARLLRPASLTFKGYVDWVGSFPHDHPREFLTWLADQVSLSLPEEGWTRLRPRYRSLEVLLQEIEQLFAPLGLEIVTSSGTSGVASIVPRNAATIDLAVRSFFMGIAQAWGIARGTALIFVMPKDTRVAMARSARIGTRHLDWTADSPVHYTLPFSATPDLIRIRAGRTFRPGLEGALERRIMNPFMGWANQGVVTRRFVKETRTRLEQCAAEERPLMLLGGLVQLHAVAQGYRLELPPGSRVATGGGRKDLYPVSTAQIRADLAAAFPGTPVSDVYGMAEANWAAFECQHGNYHIPPWVYAVVTDDADRIVPAARATGLLAFFDPVGGGELIPPFFQTADHVHLINGGAVHNTALICPCGSDTAKVHDGFRPGPGGCNGAPAPGPQNRLALALDALQHLPDGLPQAAQGVLQTARRVGGKNDFVQDLSFPRPQQDGALRSPDVDADDRRGCRCLIPALLHTLPFSSRACGACVRSFMSTSSAVSSAHGTPAASATATATRSTRLPFGLQTGSPCGDAVARPSETIRLR